MRQVTFFFLYKNFCHFSQLRKSAESRGINCERFDLLRLILSLKYCSNKPSASNIFTEFPSFGQADICACMHVKSAREEVMMHMTNVARAQQEFGQFCIEVTYLPAGM